MKFRSPMIAAAQWWQAKSAGDRGILTTSLVLLLAATWYQLAWSPLDRMRQAATADIRRLEAASRLLAQLPSQAAGSAVEPGDPQAAITSRIAFEGLVISAMETRESGLSVSFDTVSFEALARWLDSMGAIAGTRIEAARIERRPEPGTVSAEIELSLP